MRISVTNARNAVAIEVDGKLNTSTMFATVNYALNMPKIGNMFGYSGYSGWQWL